MSKPFVSFFMQAYNAEKYIGQAIESVLNQTEPNIELILVDNASTDSTGTICKQYADKDSRIRFSHNEKNTHLCPDYQAVWNEPQGEYYSIIDADDYINPEFTQVMYNAAKKCDADIVVGGAQIFCFDDPSITYKRIPPAIVTDNKKKIYNNFEALYDSLRTLWGKLFKTDFYNSNGEYAFERPIWYQNSADTLGIIRYLFRCSFFVSIDEPLYFYRYHTGSYYSSNFDVSRLHECEYLYNENLKLFKEWNVLDSNSKALLYRIHFGSVIDFIAMTEKASNISLDERLAFLQNITSDHLFCEYALVGANESYTFSKINDALDKILIKLSVEDIAIAMKYYIVRLYFALEEKKSNIKSSWYTALILSALCDSQNKYSWGSCLFFDNISVNIPISISNLNHKEFNVLIREPHVIRYIFNSNFKDAMNQAHGNQNFDHFDEVINKIETLSLVANDADFYPERKQISELLKVGKLKETLSLLLPLLDSRPLGRDDLYFAMFVFWQLHEKRLAIEAAMIANVFWDDDPDVIALCADIMSAAGNFDYSKQLYGKAIDNSTDDSFKIEIQQRMTSITMN